MPRILNFYMDDSGTRTPNRKPMPFDATTKDFFALGGVLINEEDEAHSRKLYSDFASRWSIAYPLHSVEIRHSTGNFTWLKRDSAEYGKFMNDLTQTLLAMNVLGIACVIDRPGYDARYREKYGRRQWHLCQTALCIVVERAAKFARRPPQTEACGRSFDRCLMIALIRGTLTSAIWARHSRQFRWFFASH
jgi:hypothetical protein